MAPETPGPAELYRALAAAGGTLPRVRKVGLRGECGNRPGAPGCAPGPEGEPASGNGQGGSGAAPCPRPAQPLLPAPCGAAPAAPPGLLSCPRGPPKLCSCPHPALVSRSCPQTLVLPQHLFTPVPSSCSIFPVSPSRSMLSPQASHPVPDPARVLPRFYPCTPTPLLPISMFRFLLTFPQVSSLCPFPVSPQAPHPVLVPLRVLPCGSQGTGPDPHPTGRGSVTGTGVTPRPRWTLSYEKGKEIDPRTPGLL